MATREQVDALLVEFAETDEFAEWAEFMEAARQERGKGRATVQLPAKFINRVLDELQPLDFNFYRKVYNRLCDQHGLPEEKKPVSDLPENENMAIDHRGRIFRRPLKVTTNPHVSTKKKVPAKRKR